MSSTADATAQCGRPNSLRRHAITMHMATNVAKLSVFSTLHNHFASHASLPLLLLPCTLSPLAQLFVNFCLYSFSLAPLSSRSLARYVSSSGIVAARAPILLRWLGSARLFRASINSFASHSSPLTPALVLATHEQPKRNHSRHNSHAFYSRSHPPIPPALLLLLLVPASLTRPSSPSPPLALLCLPSLPSFLVLLSLLLVSLSLQPLSVSIHYPS